MYESNEGSYLRLTDKKGVENHLVSKVIQGMSNRPNTHICSIYHFYISFQYIFFHFWFFKTMECVAYCSWKGRTAAVAKFQPIRNLGTELTPCY